MAANVYGYLLRIMDAKAFVVQDIGVLIINLRGLRALKNEPIE